MRSWGEASDPRSQLLLFPRGCHSLPVWLNTSSNLFQISHLCNGNNYFMSLLWKLNELVHIKHLHKCWECSEQHGNVGCYYTIIIIIILSIQAEHCSVLFEWLDVERMWEQGKEIVNHQLLPILLLEYLTHFLQPPP